MYYFCDYVSSNILGMASLGHFSISSTKVNIETLMYILYIVDDNVYPLMRELKMTLLHHSIIISMFKHDLVLVY